MLIPLSCLIIVIHMLLPTQAAPMPSPASSLFRKTPLQSQPTPAPIFLSPAAPPDEVLDFYRPFEIWANDQKEIALKSDKVKSFSSDKDKRAPGTDVMSQSGPSAVKKRSAAASYPSFPAEYPSCYNCEQRYSSLSSCMEASSVFQNATSIFNSPLSYISVIKCACTDTFQAVYPQCVHCFQLTNQCYYLGTDAAGTGAPEIVTNIRNICGFASSLLGGAQSANYPDYNHTFTPSVVPSFTDVTTTGVGYINEATGAIFGSGSMRQSAADSLPFTVAAIFVMLAGFFGV